MKIIAFFLLSLLAGCGRSAPSDRLILQITEHIQFACYYDNKFCGDTFDSANLVAEEPNAEGEIGYIIWPHMRAYFGWERPTDSIGLYSESLTPLKVKNSPRKIAFKFSLSTSKIFPKNWSERFRTDVSSSAKKMLVDALDKYPNKKDFRDGIYYFTASHSFTSWAYFMSPDKGKEKLRGYVTIDRSVGSGIVEYADFKMIEKNDAHELDLFRAKFTNSTKLRVKNGKFYLLDNASHVETKNGN